VARLLGLPGQALALGWGFAEGTFFFLVPDLVITLAAMFRPKRALRHLAAAIAGAVLAGALMYAWAERQPDAAQSAVAAVPYVRAEMFTRVETDYAEEGAVSLLKGSLYGIPYKVYAVVAPRHISTAEFLAMTVPARASRLVLTWGFFA
jgi:membrane protein YqaA with SNARE-associated domain